MGDETRWTTYQLAAEVGVTVETLRRFARAGLLGKPPKRGPGANWELEARTRLSICLALEAKGMSTRAMRHLTSVTSLPQLVALAGVQAPASHQAPSTEGLMGSDAWVRVPIRDGIELHVRVGLSAPLGADVAAILSALR